MSRNRLDNSNFYNCYKLKPKAYYFAFYRKCSTFVAVIRCALVSHAHSAWELKGNQVQILNSTRCCESSIQVPTHEGHTSVHTSSHWPTLPDNRLHHDREGVNTTGTSQKTCPNTKPYFSTHLCPSTIGWRKVHEAFGPEAKKMM